MADDTKDVVIVGAGIAGLMAAWLLHEPDAVLLEATDRVGGRIKSEPRGDYWLNLGAHLFPPPASRLGRTLEELGLATTPVTAGLTGLAAKGKVLSTERIETYPFRLPMSLAARLSFLRAGLRIYTGVRDYTAMSKSAVPESSKEAQARLLAYRDNQTFAAYLGRLHPEVDPILRAAVNRISAEPEELAAGAGLALFQFAGIFSRSTSEHGNLPGGSATLPERLAERLGDRIVREAEVTRVTQTDGLALVDFDHGGSSHRIHARTVIVATPAPVAGRIVENLPEPVRDALQQITYGPYVVAAILTKEDGPMPWDGMYAMVTVNESFNLLVNTASTLRSGSVRKAGGSLMVYGSAHRGRMLIDKSDEQIRDLFLRDLRAIYPETRDIVDEVVIQRWPLGVPFARPGRQRTQAALERQLGNIVLAGDYLAPFAEMETAAESGAQAASRVMQILGEREGVAGLPKDR